MKVIKWLDKHFEETIIVFFLVLISVIMLVQVVARNTSIIPSLTWAEEGCRFLWIGTVFLSLPYTVRTETMLRVTALLDLLPWKLHNLLNIIVDVVTFAMMAMLAYFSVDVLESVMAGGETSPAITMPMWIMYVFVLVGFALAALRSVQMFIIHIKNFNVPPVSSTEAAAEDEIAAGNFEMAEEPKAKPVKEGGDA